MLTASIVAVLAVCAITFGAFIGVREGVSEGASRLGMSPHLRNPVADHRTEYDVDRAGEGAEVGQEAA